MPTRDSTSKSSKRRNKRSKSRKSSRLSPRATQVFEGAADTQWTVDTDLTESAYDSCTSDYSAPALPRAVEEMPNLSEPALEHHYRGVMTKRQATNAVRKDDFILYYRKPSKELSVSIPLYLCHCSTIEEVFHFPVVRHVESNNSHWWTVLINNKPSHLFHNLSSLVRCYHLYRYTDVKTGRSEVFPLWKGGVIDTHE